MNKFTLFFTSLFFCTASVSSIANTEVSQEQVDIITAECNQEANGAVDQDIYKENCIEERLQALKEQTGQNEKEKS